MEHPCPLYIRKLSLLTETLTPSGGEWPRRYSPSGGPTPKSSLPTCSSALSSRTKRRVGSPPLGPLPLTLDLRPCARPPGSPTRPRKQPEHLLADRDYGFEGCRRLLRKRSIPHTIAERKDQRERRARRPGRRPTFDQEPYRRRNVVERRVNRLKQWRRVATRYEKPTVDYRAMVVIASLILWLPS